MTGVGAKWRRSVGMAPVVGETLVNLVIDARSFIPLNYQQSSISILIESCPTEHCHRNGGTSHRSITIR